MLAHASATSAAAVPGYFRRLRVDDAKQAALRGAIGSQDVVLVSGPPGTGKTTFIAELVLQTLRRSPGSRLLITSQTHVALDNAIERIVQADKAIPILRIGRAGDDRIAESVREFLLE